MHRNYANHFPPLPSGGVQALGVNLTYIESRPSISKPREEYDFYVDCQCDRTTLAQLVKQLEAFAVRVSVKTANPEEDEGLWGYPGYLISFFIII